MRITINGKSITIFTKRLVKPDIWEGKIGVCRGKTAIAADVNKYLEDFKANTYNKYSEINARHENVLHTIVANLLWNQKFPFLESP